MSGKRAAANRGPLLTPARRRWLYLTAAAAIPLAALYGVDLRDPAAWLTFLAAALGIGSNTLAAKHIPAAEDAE